MNKELIEQYNRVNGFMGSLNSIVDTTTMHLVIAKFSFTILIANGKLTDSLNPAERLGVINNAVEKICSDLILDRTRIKNFLLKKLDHHYNKNLEMLFTCGTLSGMGTNYGEINNELNFSSISTPLTIILNDVL